MRFRVFVLVIAFAIGNLVFPQSANASTYLPANEVVQLSAGAADTCALKQDGTVWCWGNINSTPVQISSLPEIQEIAIGQFGYSECALGINGNVYCWTYNNYSSIEQIANLPSSIEISSSDGFSCAITIAREIYCWGAVDRFNPIIPTPQAHHAVKINGFESIQDIALGRWGLCAITQAGTVECLGLIDPNVVDYDCNDGNNFFCNMGIYAITPQPVNEIGEIIEIAFSNEMVCALNSANFINCWGVFGSNVNRNPDGFVEIDIPSKTEHLIGSAAIHDQFACAITTNQRIYCWGRNLEYFGTFSNSFTSPYELPLFRSALEISVGSISMCGIFETSIRCMGSDYLGDGGNVVDNYITPSFVYGTLNAPAPPMDLGTTTISNSSVNLSWTEPELFGYETAITGYEISWSSNGDTWSNYEVLSSSNEYEISGLSAGKGYFVRIKSLDSGDNGITHTIKVYTSGTSEQSLTIVDENGEPLTGGSITWESLDGTLKSAKPYGLTNKGLVTFPKAYAGDYFAVISNGIMADGTIFSGKIETELGFSETKVIVPLYPKKHNFKIKVTLPNGKPVSNVLVTSTLNSEKSPSAPEYLTYSTTAPQQGRTGTDGEFSLSGFQRWNETYGFVTVEFNDGELIQTITRELTSDVIEIELPEMPWAEAVKPSITASLNDLVEVKVQTSDPAVLAGRRSDAPASYTSVGKTVQVIPPGGAIQTCKGKKLTSKINSFGIATLKVCASKSGVYQIQSDGIAITNSIQIKTKGGAPLPARNLVAFSPTQGQAVVSWKAPSYAGGAAIQNYVVKLSGGGGKAKTKTVKTKSVTFTGLKNATNYTAKIWAVTKNGKSDPVSVKVGVA